MIKISDEEKENLSYDDVAYLILKDSKRKVKIQDLFKKVIKVLGLSDADFEENIGTFFEQVITDKRFIMLDGGYCDLKVNHSSKVIVEEDDEDYEIISDDDFLDEAGDEDNYSDESDADDDTEDDLQDLVILDADEELDAE